MPKKKKKERKECLQNSQILIKIWHYFFEISVILGKKSLIVVLHNHSLRAVLQGAASPILSRNSLEVWTQVPPQLHWIRISRYGTQESVLKSCLQMTLTMCKLKKRCKYWKLMEKQKIIWLHNYIKNKLIKLIWEISMLETHIDTVHMFYI